ncbi:hypothetical protein HOY82DRAFT_611731 [Tuber indicum]|nr:hypothetical protein HOY82DRAFT_611731 [Tuber indicum]
MTDAPWKVFAIPRNALDSASMGQHLDQQMAQCHDTGTVWIVTWWWAIAIGFLIGPMWGRTIPYHRLSPPAPRPIILWLRGGVRAKIGKRFADETPATSQATAARTSIHAYPCDDGMIPAIVIVHLVVLATAESAPILAVRIGS